MVQEIFSSIFEHFPAQGGASYGPDGQSSALPCRTWGFAPKTRDCKVIILLLTNVNANACMNGQIQRDLADICKGTIWIYWGWHTVLLFEVSCRLVSVLLLAKLCRIMTLTPTTSHSMCNLKLNINQHSMWNQNQN